MKITIESTEFLTDINGVPVRYWKGITEDGIECKVFVHRIAVHKSEDSARFDAELLEKEPPGRVVPLRKLLV